MNKIFDNQNLKKNLTKFLTNLINSQKNQNYNQHFSKKYKIKTNVESNGSFDTCFPELLIIQIGDNLASTKYANLKVKIGHKIGIKVNYYQYKMNGEIWQNGQKITELWNYLEFENLKESTKNVDFKNETAEKVEILTLKKIKIKLIKNHIKNLLDRKIPQNQSKVTSKTNPKTDLNFKNGLIFQLPLPVEFVDLLEIDWNNFVDVDFLAPDYNLWQNLLPPTIQAIDLVLKSLIWQENLEYDLNDNLEDFKMENLKLKTNLSSNLQDQNLEKFKNKLENSLENILTKDLNSKENLESLENELIFTKKLLTQKIDLKGKIVAVIGQGKLVGAPLLTYLQRRNATIISLNKDSPNKQKLVKNADIVICASGVPNLVKSNWFKNNVIVIDAATSESNGVLVGDLDYLEIAQNNLNIDNLSQSCGQSLVKNSQNSPEKNKKNRNKKSKSLNLWICPSPGGVGPLTVLCIFWNLVAIKNIDNFVN